GFVHAAVCGGVVAEPQPEASRPRNADSTEHEERHAPAEFVDEERSGCRGDHTTYLRKRKHDPLHAASLAHRKPPRHHLRGVGKSSSFRRAEEESHQNERKQPGGNSGECSERRPDEYDSRENASRSGTIAPPTRWHCAQSVSERERHRNVAGFG